MQISQSRQGLSAILNKIKVNRAICFGWLFLIYIVSRLYYPTLFTGFMHDDWGDLGNSGGNIWDHLKTLSPFLNNWRSMAGITWALEHYFFGNEPLYYHITHLCMHLLNTFFVFLLARKLFGHTWAAFFGAFFFSVSKALITPVAWNSAAIDQKLVLFFVPSLLFYIHYQTSQKKSWMILVLSYIFFYLGLKSKLMGVTFPAIYLVYELVFRTRNEMTAKPGTYFWQVAKINLPFWILLFCYSLAHYAMPREGEYGVSLEFFHYWRSVGWYLNHATGNILQSSENIGLMAFVICGLAVLWRSRLITFGILWFLITIFPVAILLTHHFEHHLYLPMVGFGLVLSGILDKIFRSKLKKVRVIGPPLFAVLLYFYMQSGRHYFDEFAEFMVPQWARSQKAMSDMREAFPDLPAGKTTFVVYPRPGAAIFNFDYTLQMIFPNRTDLHFIVLENRNEFEAFSKNPRDGENPIDKETVTTYFLEYDPKTGSLQRLN